MRSVWKFPLEGGTGPEILIEMPRGTALLTVQVQYGQPQLWALVDPEAPKVQRCVMVYGTGHNMSSIGNYVDTFQTIGGALVFHVFDYGEL